MEKILSVAVPAYNAEKYLEKCLSSFLSKDVLDRLDIIIVDDGSSDSTGAIADQYAKKWPDTFSVIHKPNGGHGSGINSAVKVAVGKYFRVVDADDWLLTKNIQSHIFELERCEADVVINSFHRVDMKSGRQIPVEIPCAMRGKTFSIKEVASSLRAVRNCFTIHGMTYRLDCYRESGTMLTEKVFYEDNEYTTLPFLSVKSIYFSPLFLYQYLIGNQQQSISDRNLVARLSHLERVLWKICDFYTGEQRLSKATRSYIHEKLITVVSAYITTCLLRNPDRKQGIGQVVQLMGRLRKRCPEVWEGVGRQYCRLMRLHHLHISGRALDYILDLPLYRVVRDKLRK